MRRLSVVLALALLVLTALAAAADTGQVYQAHLMPNAEHGPEGHATFTLMPGGMYRMRLVITGLQRNSSHVFHIHRSSCQVPGGIIKDLGVLTANNGGVATVNRWLGEEELQSLLVNGAYLNVHAGASLPSPGITCGNIVAPGQ